jgi:phosphinothricin acetyltransferase
MRANDWKSVAEIYKEGIDTGNATFQKEVPEYEDWDKGHLKICRIVAEMYGEIVGWVALSPVSSRAVYAGVTELSIYVAKAHRGKHIGGKLLKHLIEESEKAGIWTLQVGIFPENKPSLLMHEKAGFRKIGYREKVGRMNGFWRDTVLMERRSKVVAID